MNSVIAENVITIDGPSGSGKGTVCRILANKLNYALLDSGALYRISALAAIRAGLALNDELRIAQMVAKLDIEFVASGDLTRVLLDGEDVSAAIREESTGMSASKIAPLPALRAALLTRQREFAKGPGLVADGRDMGTVVFPAARYKVFLTASAQERARRRMLQLRQSGNEDVDVQKILEDIQARDERDMNRATAPLKPAEDALQIDSSNLSIDEVVAVLVRHVQA